MNCSNCDVPVDDGALVILDKNVPVAAVCSDCTDGALVVKISLRRDTVKADFSYDQYTALEMAKKAAIGRR